jgi:quinol monooxygenase YgiN
MIYLIATLKIKPDSFEIIKKLVAPCIEGTRLEAGNISYDLFQSTTDKNTLSFVERWKDQTAIDNHFTEPHFLAWRDAGAEYILDKKLEIITPENIEQK